MSALLNDLSQLAGETEQLGEAARANGDDVLADAAFRVSEAADALFLAILRAQDTPMLTKLADIIAAAKCGEPVHVT